MPHPRAPNQIELGPGLDFFTSPLPGSAVCLILGFGGMPIGLPPFLLPPGLTVRYWVEHGQPLRGDFNLAIVLSANAKDLLRSDPVLRHRCGSPPLRHCGTPPYSDTDGRQIHDYLLTQVSDVGQVMPDDVHLNLHDTMQRVLAHTAQRDGPPRCPHVALSRGSAHRPAVLLSQVIATVAHHRPDIHEFHLYCSRSEALAPLSTPIGQWLAEGGPYPAASA